MVKEGAALGSAGSIPEGRPKSGRVWKAKQTARSSDKCKQGILSHLKKSFEERSREKEQRESAKQLEREIKEARQKRLKDQKSKREYMQKLRMANEFKNAVYQEIKPSKLKTMNKKQLRMIKKTSMNKNGQIELVNPWSGKA